MRAEYPNQLDYSGFWLQAARGRKRLEQFFDAAGAVPQSWINSPRVYPNKLFHKIAREAARCLERRAMLLRTLPKKLDRWILARWSLQRALSAQAVHRKRKVNEGFERARRGGALHSERLGKRLRAPASARPGAS